MNYLKLILIAVGVVLAALLAFSIIGIVYSALFYLFLLGIIAIGGAVAYKFLIEKKEIARLEAGTPTGIAELKNADRALEEYKRKYLSK